MKADLRSVTLCAVDCRTPALAARALRLSARSCDFADALLLSDQPFADPAFRTVLIPQLGTLDAYSRFVFQELAHHIHTPHVLIVQWDGYVLDAGAWQPEFLAHDYIGARWGHFGGAMTVGNGGFSLRSQRLLEATASGRLPWVPDAAEDVLVCRTYRQRLQDQWGIGYAPQDVADAFAYEALDPEGPTFGFHGLYNLWRHVDDDEMLNLLAQLPPQALAGGPGVLLMERYLALRKFTLARAIYDRLRLEHDEEQLFALMLRHLPSRAQAQASLAWLQRLVARAAGL